MTSLCALPTATPAGGTRSGDREQTSVAAGIPNGQTARAGRGEPSQGAEKGWPAETEWKSAAGGRLDRAGVRTVG